MSPYPRGSHEEYLAAKKVLLVMASEARDGQIVIPPWVWEALRDELDPLPKRPSDGFPFFAVF